MRENDTVLGLPSVYFPTAQAEVMQSVLAIDKKNLVGDPLIDERTTWEVVTEAAKSGYIAIGEVTTSVENLIKAGPDNFHRDFYLKWYRFGIQHDLALPYADLLRYYEITDTSETIYEEALFTINLLEATQPKKPDSEWQLIAQRQIEYLATQIESQLPHHIAVPSIIPRLDENGQELLDTDDRFRDLRRFVEKAKKLGCTEETKQIDTYLFDLLRNLPITDCHADAIHTLIHHARMTQTYSNSEKARLATHIYEQILRYPDTNLRDHLLGTMILSFGEMKDWNKALHAWHAITSYDTSLVSLQFLIKASAGYEDRIDTIRRLQKTLLAKDDSPLSELDEEEDWLRYWFLSAVSVGEQKISLLSQPEVCTYATQIPADDFLFPRMVALAKQFPSETNFRRIVHRKLRTYLQAFNKGMLSEKSARNVLLSLMLWNSKKITI